MKYILKKRGENIHLFYYFLKLDYCTIANLYIAPLIETSIYCVVSTVTSPEAVVPSFQETGSAFEIVVVISVGT